MCWRNPIFLPSPPFVGGGQGGGYSADGRTNFATLLALCPRAIGCRGSFVGPNGVARRFPLSALEGSMKIETMGKVIVSARIENMEDLYQVNQGTLHYRRDTGHRGLRRAIRHWHHDARDAGPDDRALGLIPLRTRQARTTAGPVTVQVYGTVRLTIQGRDCPSDVTELPDDCPVLIGQVPLELMDFVVDPGGQRLIGNPEHGGEHILELY